MMEQNRLIMKFEDWLEDDLDRSQNTVRTYSRVITEFLDFLNKRGTKFQETKPDDVRKWKAKRLRKISRNSARTELVALRSFFEKYCISHNLIEKSPIPEGFEIGKVALPDTYSPTDEEVERMRLIHTPKLWGGVALPDCRQPASVEFIRQVRRLLVFELIIGSGLRCFEAAKVKFSDCNVRNRSLIVEGKGRKIRSTIVSTECVTLLSWKSVLPFSPMQALLKSSVSTINRVISAGGVTVDAAGPVTPHALRRYFATRLQRKGLGVEVISKLLGHESIQTTMRYLKLTTDQVLEQAKRIG